MTPVDCYHRIMGPAMAQLTALGGPPRSRQADIMLLAIAGQESDWTHRRQHDGGPARGLWQFERRGAVAGVLGHARTRDIAARVCRTRPVAVATPEAVHAGLEVDDMLVDRSLPATLGGAGGLGVLSPYLAPK